MEVKVKKLSETYASGNLNLRKLTDSLKMKAYSDLEEVTSMISSQTTAVENLMQSASLEASEVLSEIRNSLSEQQKMLAFSAQHQAEGLNRSSISAQGISNAAIKFSNDLHGRASKLMKLLE